MLQAVIKASGMILVIFCTTSIGAALAHTLFARVDELETAIAALDALKGEFTYSLAPPDEAVCRLEMRDSLALAAYLPACASLCRQGRPFPEAWKRAVEENPRNLNHEDCEILSSLSDVLGQTDLDAQLMRIDGARAQLFSQLQSARTRCGSHAQLYRMMGLLSGAFVVVVFI